MADEADTRAGEDNAARRPRKRRRRRIVGVVVLVIVLLFAAITARVIELAGPGDDGRDARAIQLANEGRTDYLVQSTKVGDTHCLPAPQDVKLLCFHPDPATTRGEAQWIGREAAQRHWKSVILVTTPDQAYRAKLRVGRCFPGKVYVATSTLPWKRWFTHLVPLIGRIRAAGRYDQFEYIKLKRW